LTATLVNKKNRIHISKKQRKKQMKNIFQLIIKIWNINTLTNPILNEWDFSFNQDSKKFKFHTFESLKINLNEKN